MTPTVKTCPFCGREPLVTSGGEPECHWFWMDIECNNNRCAFPYVKGTGCTSSLARRAAIKAWNRREGK